MCCSSEALDRSKEGRVIPTPNSARPIHAKLTHLSVYDSTDGVSVRAASPSSPSSLTHVHRCIGSRNSTRQTLPTSAKLTYLSVYDNRDVVSGHGDSPSPPSSLAHVHRDVVPGHGDSPSSPSLLTYVHWCIGSRNATRQTRTTSAKLTSLSIHDIRNDTTQCMGDG